MRRVSELAADEIAMNTLVEITSVFEGLASMRIAQIKDQVVQATKFYRELWSIYSQIRVSEEFSFGREKSDKQVSPKQLMILITAEGGFSGDIDQKLIELVLKDYNPEENDIIVIGRHGALQLSQAHIQIKKYYKMPTRDHDINVEPILAEIKEYQSTKMYYQEYVSLMAQDVKSIDLSTAINQQGSANDDPNKEYISEQNYIFEPSTYDVVAHLEKSMMRITVNQLILDSKLAQYASRFKAMSQARDRADDMKGELHLDYNRAKRSVKDERLKEIVNGLKKARAGAGI